MDKVVGIDTLLVSAVNTYVNLNVSAFSMVNLNVLYVCQYILIIFPFALVGIKQRNWL